MDDLALLDATAQAELVRSKEVLPFELVEAAIGRIERLNPQLNAVITPMYDEARQAVDSVSPDAPFAGVPFLLKDLGQQYAGVRYAQGSRFLNGYVSDHDTELVVRHRKAGLITLGKTNTPEFGILPTTEPERCGPSRNPWNTDCTPGGSSGGSAAAVAAGLVPMAHGNDGGGSIRIPASCCGLVGLKPTRARVPVGPDLGEMWHGFAIDHAVTRSVRDSAALLDATCGPMPGDPYAAPAPVRPYREEVGADPGRLRIAFTSRSPLGTPVHEDCVAAVLDAAWLCLSLGHEMVDATLPLDAEPYGVAFGSVVQACTAAMLEDLASMVGRSLDSDQFEANTWTFYEQGRALRAADYIRAVDYIQHASRDIADFFSGFDLLLTPTLGEPPLSLGTLAGNPDDPEAAMERVFRFIPFTPVFNATGQPAMSLPLYWNGDGLPIGTQFVGRFGDEATLFRLAAQLEAARPWANRHPPVFA